MIGLKAKPHLEEEARERMQAGKKINPEVNCTQGRNKQSRDQAGALVNVSGATIERVSKVVARGAPELQGAVMAGIVSPHAAEALSSLPHDEQREITVSERVAIKRTIEEEIGDRRGRPEKNSAEPRCFPEGEKTSKIAAQFFPLPST